MCTYFTKFKPIFSKLFYTEVFVGGLTGMLATRYIQIKYNDKKYISVHQSLPIILGLFYYLLLPSIIFIDYYGKLCMLDKFVDKLFDKYNFEIKRYHQCDNKPNNKYYGNSDLYIDIFSK